MIRINLINVVSLFCLIFLIGCSSVTEHQQSISIIPYPTQVIQHAGWFQINSSTSLNVNSSELDLIANYFRNKLSESTGYKFANKHQSNNDITIKLVPESGITPEGYTLKVCPESVVIEASTPQGSFYGMQTLLQLLPSSIMSTTKVKGEKWTIPAVTIQDAPRFDYRGVMIDACRHFVPVDEVKKLIDVFSIYKINKLHWHLTDDQLWTIEIKKHPKLVEFGSKRIEVDGSIHQGFYTQDQIREVVAYAKERGIDIVPEIEMPGHALAAIVAYPWLSCKGEGDFKVRNLWGVESDVYCAGKETTFQFIDDVLTEVLELFPNEYIHIGGDECPKDMWKQCPHCQKRIKDEGLKDEHALQSYFMHRVEKMLNDKGRKLIGWDEIIEGGLSSTATVMYWRGWISEKSVLDTLGPQNKIIMTPLGRMYFNFYQGKHEAEPQIAHGQYLPVKSVYEYEPFNREVSPERHKNIWGVQANLWTEYIYTPQEVEYMLFPRILALSEIGWSTSENKSYNRFESSLDNHLSRLSYCGVNYHIPMPEGPQSDNIKFIDDVTLTFTNSRNYPMVYTLDGSEPSASSMRYTGSITINSDCTFKIATLIPNGQIGLRTIELKQENPTPSCDIVTKPGIVRIMSDAKFNNLAELSRATWTDPEVIPDFAFPYDDYKLTGAAIYTGYVEIPEDGAYIFASDADELQIAGDTIIVNDGVMTMHQLSRASKSLSKGKHPFKLIFTNTPHGGREKIYNQIGFMFGVNGVPLQWTSPTMLSHKE